MPLVEVLFLCWLVEIHFLSPLIFTGLVSLLTWLKGANMCLAAESDKNIVVANDKLKKRKREKKKGSSTWEILAVLQCAPPFLMQWFHTAVCKQTSVSLLTTIGLSCLVFARSVICRVQCTVYYVHCPLNHFTTTTNINKSQVSMHQIITVLELGWKQWPPFQCVHWPPAQIIVCHMSVRYLACLLSLQSIHHNQQLNSRRVTVII